MPVLLPSLSPYLAAAAQLGHSEAQPALAPAQRLRDGFPTAIIIKTAAPIASFRGYMERQTKGIGANSVDLKCGEHWA
ncbi:MAG: hypothetical protein DMG24_10115 [Acidobacteria bacterium]|nr:MAG: hypothetical protein DMG24_10115 [Acidobacteriota bacterium]